MIQLVKVLEILKKVNWEKAGKIAAVATPVVATASKVVKDHKQDSKNRIDKKLKRLDKLVKKGRINQTEYDKIRRDLFENVRYDDI